MQDEQDFSLLSRELKPNGPRSHTACELPSHFPLYFHLFCFTVSFSFSPVLVSSTSPRSALNESIGSCLKKGNCNLITLHNTPAILSSILYMRDIPTQYLYPNVAKIRVFSPSFKKKTLNKMINAPK